MRFIDQFNFSEYIDREVAEHKKERFRRKYADSKKISLLKRRRTLWERLKEWRNGKHQDDL